MSLSPVGTPATSGPNGQALDDDYSYGAVCGMRMSRETEVVGGNWLQCHFSTINPTDLTWVRTQGTAEGSQRQTALVMAWLRPVTYLYCRKDPTSNLGYDD